ncbi:MAG: NAD-dependent epimerase/dehydratase [Fibrobacteria bacterium]|nr:NAD-dependent epimerase/dehydratase [Fibrobacteria bacterium]
MRVLLTGATGFVGDAVTARLLAAGHAVTALSRDPAAARARLPEAVEILPWKPASGPLTLPANLDAVIHLAGASIAGGRWTASRKRKLWSSRVDGTRALVAALAATGRFPEAFVCASGMGYHGDAGDCAVLPGDPPGGDFLGRLAAAWEAEANKATNFGARVVCVRLGMVLGREGGALPPQILATRFGLGAVLGKGDQYWPWIRVGAAADLFLEAASDPRITGPVHAAAGAPLTQGEFVRALGAALRRPVWFRIPAWVLRLGLGEMADLFLHGQKVVLEPGRPGGENAGDSLSAALRDLLDPR